MDEHKDAEPDVDVEEQTERAEVKLPKRLPTADLPPTVRTLANLQRNRRRIQ